METKKTHWNRSKDSKLTTPFQMQITSHLCSLQEDNQGTIETILQNHQEFQPPRRSSISASRTTSPTKAWLFWARSSQTMPPALCPHPGLKTPCATCPSKLTRKPKNPTGRLISRGSHGRGPRSSSRCGNCSNCHRSRTSLTSTWLRTRTTCASATSL